MKAVDLPDKFPIPFGNSAAPGYIRDIPVTSQIGIQDGAASLTDGFVPDNFTPVASGGVPPFGQDMNGILFETTAMVRWMTAGGPLAYDATFQTQIGGYPLGAYIRSGDTLGTWWLSTTDDNLTNPDTGGAGWAINRVGNTYGTSTGTANALVVTYALPVADYGLGLVLYVQANLTNTNAATLNAGGGVVSVTRNDGTALVAGDLRGGSVYALVFDGTGFRVAGALPSTLAGAGLIADGAGAIRVNIVGQTAKPVPAQGDRVMIADSAAGDALKETTAGAIAGLAANSDEFWFQSLFLGMM